MQRDMNVRRPLSAVGISISHVIVVGHQVQLDSWMKPKLASVGGGVWSDGMRIMWTAYFLLLLKWMFYVCIHVFHWQSLPFICVPNVRYVRHCQLWWHCKLHISVRFGRKWICCTRNIGCHCWLLSVWKCKLPGCPWLQYFASVGSPRLLFVFLFWQMSLLLSTVG